MFLLNSRLGLFTAALFRGRSFSRSYGTILPSSLATAHPSALGYSPRLSVSISGTDCFGLALEVFLGSLLRCTIPSSEDLGYCRDSAGPAGFPTSPIPTHFNVLFRQYAALSLLRHPIETKASNRILTVFPSEVPFRVVLRIRLTLIRLTLIRNP